VNTFSRFSLVVVSLLAAAACTSSTEGDEAEETEDALSRGGKQLVGAYVESGAGSIRGLILSRESVNANANKFSADVDTGVRCITTPCPSAERVEGTFTAGSKTITLTSPTASPLVQSILGKFNYTLVGDKLSLSRRGSAQSLSRAPSYCAAPTAQADCDAQDLVRPRCIGTWSCAPTSTCSFQCGAAPGMCIGGNKVTVDGFAPSTDGKECKVPTDHCVTSDGSACPMLMPLPPDFCADGTVVRGAGSFIASADGKKCKMPEVHCVTKNPSACPALTPVGPGFCPGGTVVAGAPSFMASADGKECQMPSIHCVTNDASACP